MSWRFFFCFHKPDKNDCSPYFVKQRRVGRCFEKCKHFLEKYISFYFNAVVKILLYISILLFFQRCWKLDSSLLSCLICPYPLHFVFSLQYFFLMLILTFFIETLDAILSFTSYQFSYSSWILVSIVVCWQSQVDCFRRLPVPSMLNNQVML